MYQSYQTEVLSEYILVGNDAIMKCQVPSFVTDFIDIVSWMDSEGQMYQKHSIDGKSCSVSLKKGTSFGQKTCGFFQFQFVVLI